MLHLIDPGLDDETLLKLSGYQAEVDAACTYAEQVEAGRDLYDRYSGNAAFRTVRNRLAVMCSGARRCSYCEDSVGDEIEHIRPKALYPEKTFVWENYLLACGQCNRGKSGRFSVIVCGGLMEVTRRRNAPVLRPPEGPTALIVPREENPLAFLDLEIVDTFMFLPREDLQGIDKERAEYTIEVLKLNRDVLLAARRDAYSAYRARLFEYRGLRDNGADEADLGILKEGIATTMHPTVWREMQRQHDVIEGLRALFRDVPEALNWQHNLANTMQEVLKIGHRRDVYQ